MTPEPAGPVLVVAGLHAAYGDVPVLRGVSLAVDPGEIVALVGANGAGKTTTLRAIAGLLAPAAGEIRFAGARIEAAARAHRGGKADEKGVAALSRRQRRGEHRR